MFEFPRDERQQRGPKEKWTEYDKSNNLKFSFNCLQGISFYIGHPYHIAFTTAIVVVTVHKEKNKKFLN